MYMDRNRHDGQREIKNEVTESFMDKQRIQMVIQTATPTEHDNTVGDV